MAINSYRFVRAQYYSQHEMILYRTTEFRWIYEHQISHKSLQQFNLIDLRVCLLIANYNLISSPFNKGFSYVKRNTLYTLLLYTE